MPAAEAASNGECMTGGEPTAAGYSEWYNNGTGTLTALGFTKYTGSTCESVEEEAIFTVAELKNTRPAPFVVFGVEDIDGT